MLLLREWLDYATNRVPQMQQELIRASAESGLRSSFVAWAIRTSKILSSNDQGYSNGAKRKRFRSLLLSHEVIYIAAPTVAENGLLTPNQPRIKHEEEKFRAIWRYFVGSPLYHNTNQGRR